MYRGFNINFSTEALNIDGVYNYGVSVLSKSKKTIEESLEKYILTDKSINGSKMQEDWFPTIKSHIFLSHSHKDERKAIILAGLLNVLLGLDVFIDSLVWGYSDHLLKLIDNEYCLNPDKNSYNYNLRNRSTSHVHMMLATALNKMIDKTECLFFMNTPNSVTTDEVINKTNSQWIYHEITTSQIIRRNIPRRLIRERTRTFSKSIQHYESINALNINYDIDLQHLTDISELELFLWVNFHSIIGKNPEKALDKLYELHPTKSDNILND
ncbi:MAG TPA: hypothetical protein VK167_02630 [Flavipsychrobacter sp.]|nr:hypothetical protein [Flavipsychrobacter sp.]